MDSKLYDSTLPPLKRYKFLNQECEKFDKFHKFDCEVGDDKPNPTSKSDLPAKKRKLSRIPASPPPSYCLPAKKRIWAIPPFDLNVAPKTEQIEEKNCPEAQNGDQIEDIAADDDGIVSAMCFPKTDEQIDAKNCPEAQNGDQVEDFANGDDGSVCAMRSPKTDEQIDAKNCPEAQNCDQIEDVAAGDDDGTVCAMCSPKTDEQILGKNCPEAENGDQVEDIVAAADDDGIDGIVSAMCPPKTDEQIPAENCLEAQNGDQIEDIAAANDDDEDDDGIVCAICQSTDADSEDPIVLCDGCDLMVHCSCYGHPLIKGIPEGDWFCQKCLNSNDSKFEQNTCCLCPVSNGAMKATIDGKWAHIVCALFVPEVFFNDPQGREGIDCSMVPEKRFQELCYLCESKNGCVLDCSENKCPLSFHVTCGLNHDLYVEYQQQGKKKSGVVAGFCRKHTDLWQKQQQTGKFKIVAKD